MRPDPACETAASASPAHQLSERLRQEWRAFREANPPLGKHVPRWIQHAIKITLAKPILGTMQFVKDLTGLVPRAAAQWWRNATKQPSDAGIHRRAKLDLFLCNPGSRLVFPVCANPLVSILVLSYNRDDQLLECLESVLAHSNDVPYELIVADNASIDRAPAILGRVQGARVILNRDNLGFVRGNNAAAVHARGRYLMLLNNDTIVTPGWLSELVRTLQTWPRCGAVGPRFLYPDGRLQEAGAICLHDGRVYQYGCGGDPHAPDYQHVREVDYCSGAGLLIRTDLFRRLGGFDERYAPCYYEDLDLCFGVTFLGHRVVYQPASAVFHHGPSPTGMERTVAMCSANQAKFIEKWRDVLPTQSPGGMPSDLQIARDRRPGLRVLVVDTCAGAAIGLASGGAVVTLFCDSTGTPAEEVSRLRQLGVEVIPAGLEMLDGFCRDRIGCYEAALVGELSDATSIVALIRRRLPLTPVFRDASALAVAHLMLGDVPASHRAA